MENEQQWIYNQQGHLAYVLGVLTKAGIVHIAPSDLMTRTVEQGIRLCSSATLPSQNSTIKWPCVKSYSVRHTNIIARGLDLTSVILQWLVGSKRWAYLSPRWQIDTSLELLFILERVLCTQETMTSHNLVRNLEVYFLDFKWNQKNKQHRQTK